MYQIVKTRDYLKSVAKYGKVLGQARLEKMESQLANNPTFHASITKIQGKDNLYRYRIGEFRVFYIVEENRVTVTMIDISPRGDAYK